MAAAMSSFDNGSRKGPAVGKSFAGTMVRAPPHASPGLPFYSLGSFNPSTFTSPANKSTNFKADSGLNNFLKIRRHYACPGASATKQQRNVNVHSVDLELNIKPSLHDRFDKKYYLPGKYLNPYQNTNGRFGGRFVNDSEAASGSDINKLDLHRRMKRPIITKRM